MFFEKFSTVHLLFLWEVKHGEPPSKWLQFYGVIFLYKSAQQNPWNYVYLTFTNNNNNNHNNNVKLHFVFTNKTRYVCYVLLLTNLSVCLGQKYCDKTSGDQSYNAR